MAVVPETSTTLLRDLAGDAQHARWREFVARYRPMMEAFLRARFPTLEADDLVQETLLELVRALPAYRYVPSARGHFHSYLTGILKHRALRALAQRRRADAVREDFAADRAAPQSSDDAEESAWRESLMEVALAQLLADESVHDRTKRVFTRVAVDGEDPRRVAEAFQMTRHAVDQVRNRMLGRLRELVAALESVDAR